MYVIVFDRLSPGQSQDRLWLQPHFGLVTSFFFIVVSMLLSLIPENLERQHSTQKTANYTPKKCIEERIFEGNHISCPLNRALQDWKNEFSNAVYVNKHTKKLCNRKVSRVKGRSLLLRRSWHTYK